MPIAKRESHTAARICRASSAVLQRARCTLLRPITPLHSTKVPDLGRGSPYELNLKRAAARTISASCT